MTYQIAPDYRSSSRRDNRRIVELFNCCRNAGDGRTDKQAGMSFDRNRLSDIVVAAQRAMQPRSRTRSSRTGSSSANRGRTQRSGTRWASNWRMPISFPAAGNGPKRDSVSPSHRRRFGSRDVNPHKPVRNPSVAVYSAVLTFNAIVRPRPTLANPDKLVRPPGAHCCFPWHACLPIIHPWPGRFALKRPAKGPSLKEPNTISAKNVRSTFSTGGFPSTPSATC
jgi:hypothetical protein